MDRSRRQSAVHRVNRRPRQPRRVARLDAAILLQDAAVSPPDRTRALWLAALVSCAVHLGLFGIVRAIPFVRTPIVSSPVVVKLVPASALATETVASPSLSPPSVASPPREPSPAPVRRMSKKVPARPTPVAQLAPPPHVATTDERDRTAGAESAADMTAHADEGIEERDAASDALERAGDDDDALRAGGRGISLAVAASGASPRPPYPTLARRMHIEGVVLLRVNVRADGGVGAVEVASSSGSPLLDESALRTVRDRWRFEPARRGSETVQSWLQIPMKFQLE